MPAYAHPLVGLVLVFKRNDEEIARRVARDGQRAAAIAKHEVSGPGGLPIQIHTMLDVFLGPTNIELLSDAELSALELLRNAARRLAAPAAAGAAGEPVDAAYSEVPPSDAGDG